MAFAYAGMFAPFAVLLAFVPLWLEAEGLGTAEIGLLLALALAARTVTTPPLTALADRVGDRATLYVVAAVVAAVASLGYFLPASATIYTITAVLVSVPMALAIPLGDAIGLTGVRRLGIDYGAVRLWGSVAFMVVTVAAGEAVAWLGAGIVPFLFTTLLVLTVATGATMPRLPARPRGPSVAARSVLSRPLLLVFGAAALAMGSHATYYGFSSIHWTRLGFTPTFVGVLWAVGVLAEVVLFALARRLLLDRMPLVLMTVGLVGGLVRWAAFTVEGGAAWFVLNSVMHAGSFAAVHLALQSYIAVHVDDERQGAAQAVSHGIAGPLMAAATYASGRLYEIAGGDAFWMPAAMCGLGALLLLPLLIPRGRDRAATR